MLKYLSILPKSSQLGCWRCFTSRSIGRISGIVPARHIENSYTCRNLSVTRTPISNITSYSRLFIELFGRSKHGNKRLLLDQNCTKFSTSAREYNRDQESSSSNPDDDRPDLKKIVFATIVSSLAVVVLAYYTSQRNFAEPNELTLNSMTWKQFLEEVLPSGEVKEVHIAPSWNAHSFHVILHPGASLKGQTQTRNMKITNVMDVNQAESVIRDIEKRMRISPTNKVPIYHHNNLDLRKLIAGSLLLVLMTAVSFFLFRMIRTISPKINLKGTEKDVRKVVTGIKFSDVAGCTEAKEEVMEFVHCLKNPERYQRLGAKMPRGCLLTGPPGVGKTLLAKAVATDAGVTFLFKSGSDFVEMIGGLGAKRVRSLFKQARDEAPCIVYIDELDAVGKKRSDAGDYGGGNSERDQTLNQILVEMDGMLSSQHDVVVMASTNRADVLDPALLRPGRFDRHIVLDLPTRGERKEIFEQHLKGLKLYESPSKYSQRLADLTPGMSGADIANICNEAALFAAREKHMFIDSRHFEYAVERILAGSRRKTSSLVEEERNIIAVHEAGHALAGWMLKHTDALMKVSIVPRTNSAMGFSQTLLKEKKLYSPSQLLDIMCMALGGRAAENIVFDSITQGAQDDLKKVTDMAYAQVKYLGFNPVVGNLSFAEEEESFVKPFSETFSQLIDSEVRKIITNAHEHTDRILKENRVKLDILTKELLKREVLDYGDIVKLIGPPAYGDKTQIYSMNYGPLGSDFEKKED